MLVVSSSHISGFGGSARCLTEALQVWSFRAIRRCYDLDWDLDSVFDDVLAVRV